MTTGDEAGPRDPTIRAVTVAVMGSGVVIAALGLLLASGRFAGSVLVGTAITVLNFLALARVGRAMTSTGPRAGLWGLAYPVKILALFGGLFLLLRSGHVNVLGVLCGLCSLVPGIVLGGVAASRQGP